MSSNKIVQGLWVGGNLSKVEQLSIKSFIANGHDYHLYVYDEVKNIPEGTKVLDGNNIVPESKIFTYKSGFFKGSFSGFADLFRWELLNKKGGWWVDLDVICLRYFDIPQDSVIASSYEYQYGVLPNANVLKFPLGSDLVLKAVTEINKIDTSSMKGLEMGPFLVQKLSKEVNNHEFVVPFSWFNPLTPAHIRYRFLGLSDSTPNRIKEILRPIIKPGTMVGARINKEAFSVHLWNEYWRKWGIDKNGSFNKNSKFELLKKKYMVV